MNFLILLHGQINKPSQTCLQLIKSYNHIFSEAKSNNKTTKKAKKTRLSENEEMRASILALMCGNF